MFFFIFYLKKKPYLNILYINMIDNVILQLFWCLWTLKSANGHHAHIPEWSLFKNAKRLRFIIDYAIFTRIALHSIIWR